MNSLLELIKKISSKTIAAEKPCDFCFGKVISESPLKIFIEQKITLDSAQLVLTRNVTDFKTKIDGAEVKIENSLQVGEKVVLLRQKGGQKFLVLDRVINT
jgi:hypothetical protein